MKPTETPRTVIYSEPFISKCYWVTVQTNPHGDHVYSGQGPALREAIDAAMSAAKKAQGVAG